MKILLAPLALAMAMNVSSSHAAYADLTDATLLVNLGNPSTLSANYANLIGAVTFKLNVTSLAAFDWNFSDTERADFSFANTTYRLDNDDPFSLGTDVRLASTFSLGDYDETGWRTYAFGTPLTGIFEIRSGSYSGRLTTSLQLRIFRYCPSADPRA